MFVLPDNLPRWIPPEQILKKLPDSVLATIDDIKLPKTKQLRGGINLSCRRIFFVTDDNLRSAAWLQMTSEVRAMMEAHPRYVNSFIGLDYRLRLAIHNLRSMVVEITLED